MALGSDIKVRGHLSWPQPFSPASSRAGSRHSQPLLCISGAQRHSFYNILGDVAGQSGCLGDTDHFPCGPDFSSWELNVSALNRAPKEQIVQGGEKVYLCEYTKHSLFLYYCLLTIALFSTQMTGNLLYLTLCRVCIFRNVSLGSSLPGSSEVPFFFLEEHQGKPRRMKDLIKLVF